MAIVTDTHLPTPSLPPLACLTPLLNRIHMIWSRPLMDTSTA